MKRKPIYPIPLIELEKLSTRQLLTRLKQLQQCEESLYLSDRNSDEITENNSIEFKDTDKWKTAYQEVKQILASREHIEKGVALTEKRQQKAVMQRSYERKILRTKNY